MVPVQRLTAALRSTSSRKKPAFQLLFLMLLGVSLCGANAVAQAEPARSCMDDYFEKLGFSGPLMPARTGPGAWEWSAEFSPVSEIVTFLACLPASSGDDERKGADYPSLFLICGVGAMDAVAIVVSDYRARNEAVVVKAFDRSDAVREKWTLSLGGRALLAPQTSAEFIEQLLLHDELSLEVTLRDEEVLAFSYDLRGADEALETVSQACRW